MNIHNPALEAQVAAVKAARARMGMNRYSPRVMIPTPQPVEEPPAPEPNPTYEPPAPEDAPIAVRAPRVRDIILAAARASGLPPKDVVSHRRTGDVILPRQVAMYLAKTMTTLSLPQIGRQIAKRDHTTVLHAVRKVEGLIASGDPKTLEAVIAIVSRLH